MQRQQVPAARVSQTHNRGRRPAAEREGGAPSGWSGGESLAARIPDGKPMRACKKPTKGEAGPAGSREREGEREGPSELRGGSVRCGGERLSSGERELGQIWRELRGEGAQGKGGSLSRERKAEREGPSEMRGSSVRWGGESGSSGERELGDKLRGNPPDLLATMSRTPKLLEAPVSQTHRIRTQLKGGLAITGGSEGVGDGRGVVVGAVGRKEGAPE